MSAYSLQLSMLRVPSPLRLLVHSLRRQPLMALLLTALQKLVVHKRRLHTLPPSNIILLDEAEFASEKVDKYEDSSGFANS